MSRSEQFLEAFAQVERHLRTNLSDSRGFTFYRLVEVAAQQIYAVRRAETDLKEFADLRNAIVHERTDGHVIAEPLERTVTQLQQIAKLLLEPPSVAKLFHRPVTSVSGKDTLFKAVTLMSRNSYSQLPVVASSGFQGVLTSNTVARWLGAKGEADSGRASVTSVEEVLLAREKTETWRFLTLRSTAFDVLQAFDEEQAAGHTLSAILVSSTGRPAAPLLGIVTLSDLPVAYRLISPPSPRRPA